MKHGTFLSCVPFALIYLRVQMFPSNPFALGTMIGNYFPPEISSQ